MEHNEFCPIATGEEVGDAYCACPYIEAALKAQVEHLTEIPTPDEA